MYPVEARSHSGKHLWVPGTRAGPIPSCDAHHRIEATLLLLDSKGASLVTKTGILAIAASTQMHSEKYAIKSKKIKTKYTLTLRSVSSSLPP